VSGRQLSDRRLRFRRSRRFPTGRIQLYIEWRDLWWPLFIGKDAVYITLIPIIGVAVLRVARTERVNPLDEAMHTVWLEGKWEWITRCMSGEAREAAVAAVLRHSNRLRAIDGDRKPLKRESLAWWDD
jgi:hypothetical protein